MCIKETCFNANLFPVKNYKNMVIISHSMFLPLDPANPLYCIRLWYIDTTYVSGKLGPGGGGGGNIPQIENGDDPIF